YSYHNSGFGPLPRIHTIYLGGYNAEHGHIVFNWEFREDKTRGYTAGYEYWNDYRLESIDLYADDTNNSDIRNYKLYYQDEEEQSYADRVSRLGAIHTCVGAVCGRATYFQWTIPTISPVFAHSNPSVFPSAGMG